MASSIIFTRLLWKRKAKTFYPTFNSTDPSSNDPTLRKTSSRVVTERPKLLTPIASLSAVSRLNNSEKLEEKNHIYVCIMMGILCLSNQWFLARAWTTQKSWKRSAIHFVNFGTFTRSLCRPSDVVCFTKHWESLIVFEQWSKDHLCTASINRCMWRWDFHAHRDTALLNTESGKYSTEMNDHE